MAAAIERDQPHAAGFRHVGDQRILKGRIEKERVEVSGTKRFGGVACRKSGMDAREWHAVAFEDQSRRSLGRAVFQPNPHAFTAKVGHSSHVGVVARDDLHGRRQQHGDSAKLSRWGLVARFSAERDVGGFDVQNRQVGLTVVERLDLAVQVPARLRDGVNVRQPIAVRAS